MATTYRIAEIARRTGFNASTLRYYEQIGLLPRPDRTDAGYRVYGDRAIVRLRFVARAKQLGCTLDEIADLLRAWDGDRCEPVADRLRALLATKRTETTERIAELTAFTTELQHAAVSLAAAGADPCDESCACMLPDDTPAEHATAKPIACTLAPGDTAARLDEWQHILAFVTEREALHGGIRLSFDADAPIGEVAQLAAAEQDCCRFFSFTLTIDSRGVGLEVRAPGGSEEIVGAIFGAAALAGGERTARRPVR